MIIVPGSIPMYIGTPAVPASQIPAQIRSIEAYYTRNPDSDCGATPCVLFYPISGADISRYAIYRSIIGFETTLPAPSTVAGKTLEIAVNLGATQTITFNGTTPLLEQFSAITGGYSVLSKLDATRLIFRIDEGSVPGVLQIIGGTAMADFGLTAHTISNQSDSYLIAYVNAMPADDTVGVEYCDIDGTIYDSYRVSTVNMANELSKPTAYVVPSETTGKVCWVYGLVSNAAGVRIPDAAVNIRILEYPQSVVAPSYINSDVITTYTGGNGRFEIAVIQGALVEISIPSIYFNRKVRIPDQNRAALSDLPVDKDYLSNYLLS
jgi:hypothetical protein